MKPTMIVLAGPNGAGKSTLYETRIAPSFAGPACKFASGHSKKAVVAR